jgi:hypothetical protein
MASITITFNNYSKLDLTLQKPKPPAGWSTDGGLSAPTVGTVYSTDTGDTFAIDVATQAGFSGELDFVGAYGNRWTLKFGWDSNLNPSCTLVPAPGGTYVATDGDKKTGVNANLNDPNNPIYSWDFIATTAKASQAHATNLIKAQGSAQAKA